MSEHIRPLGNRLIVKRAEALEKSKGGIIIPDMAKEKPVEGEVLAVGPGAWLESGERRPIDVKVGDTVLFGKYAGTTVESLGKDHVILTEDDVMGVVTKTAEQA